MKYKLKFHMNQGMTFESGISFDNIDEIPEKILLLDWLTIKGKDGEPTIIINTKNISMLEINEPDNQG